MFLNRYCPALLLVSSNLLFSQQNQVADTTKATQLKDVVVTAQFGPQSVKKAVNHVRVISKEDMKKLAATNLADILNQYLNIVIVPSSGTGRSTVSMFGLDGSYFKILVDNVPIVSDSSMGNNIDLTQINLDDIEQIEIIEGSMGVTHGAGSVSGILNIITKKSTRHKWEINASAQEETVGREYAAFSQGKHIQSLKVSHKVSDGWFASVGFNRNDFDGFLDGRNGEGLVANGKPRGYTQLPKLQYFTNGIVSYNKNNFKAFYRFDYLNENLDFFNPTIRVTPNPPFGNNYFASDNRYKTERFYHHLNLTGSLLTLNYNVSVSHQKQTRNTENFTFDFQTNHEVGNYTTKFQEANVLYSTGTLSNFFKNSKADIQLGYELSNTLGFALVDGENQTLVPIEKRFENYDFFVSSEINVTDKFLIRPGLRTSIQSRFDSQYASSLGFRYLVGYDVEVRSSMGKSYRIPTFEELYSKIKFSGHQFYGNENLVPELSTSLDLSIKKTTSFDSGVKILSKISAAYLDVDDRIDMAYVGSDPGSTDPIYQYINVSSYKMWNIATDHQFSYKNWSASLGLICVGISQLIDNGEARSDDRFLYNMQANAKLSYDWAKANMMFSVFYKFNGKQQQFAAAVENNQAAYKLSEIESYSFLDATIRKSFFKNAFELTFGARNLLDVTAVNQGLSTGGAHDNSTSILLGYGRSYFIKLLYNLNF